MKKKFALRPIAATLALALAGMAQAQDNGITHKISGYGTLAGTFTDTNEAEFIGGINHFKGANKQIDTGVDSRMGLQGVVTFDPQFSMTAQALMVRRQTKDFDVGVEWLYGQYSPIPEVSVRLGRVMIPVFLLSDSLNVGYAQPWLRAPGELYTQATTNTLDGLQISGRKAFGSLVLNAQIATGKSSFAVNVAGLGALTFSADHMMSANITAEYGSWLARVGQIRQHANGALSSVDEFSTVGLQFDDGRAVVLAEAGQRKNSISIYDGKSWYVAGGWRFGKLLPMVTYASKTYEIDSPTVKPNKSASVSVRYDVATNTALKLQVDRIETTSSNFINKTAAVPAKATVAALGLDFVF